MIVNYVTYLISKLVKEMDVYILDLGRHLAYGCSSPSGIR